MDQRVGAQQRSKTKEPPKGERFARDDPHKWADMIERQVRIQGNHVVALWFLVMILLFKTVFDVGEWVEALFTGR